VTFPEWKPLENTKWEWWPTRSWWYSFDSHKVNISQKLLSLGNHFIHVNDMCCLLQNYARAFSFWGQSQTMEGTVILSHRHCCLQADMRRKARWCKWTYFIPLVSPNPFYVFLIAVVMVCLYPFYVVQFSF
jgi:hypothetical protein